MATGLARFTTAFFFMTVVRRESNFPAVRRRTGVLDYVCASHEIFKDILTYSSRMAIRGRIAALGIPIRSDSRANPIG